MWCHHCGQDVPGIPSLEAGEFSCARCAKTFGSSPRQDDDAASAPSNSTDASPAKAATTGATKPVEPTYDGWELEEELRHVGRVLQRAKGETPTDTAAGLHAARLDAAQAGPPPWHVRTPQRKPELPTSAPAGSGPVLAGLTWTALSIGTIAFVCGGILIGWSVVTSRQDLWTIGTPIALGGQIALLIGLIFQLDRLWLDNRRAAAKLDVVDEQLHELKTATTLLGATHGPSGAFYAHWADGAGAQILLTDLKSQLDLLAVKLNQR
jgi:hypothetical protein